MVFGTGLNGVMLAGGGHDMTEPGADDAFVDTLGKNTFYLDKLTPDLPITTRSCLASDNFGVP